MTVTERRIAILKKLCIRRHDTVMNLCREFYVSRRTMQRDLYALTLSYPVYSTPGIGGGVSVVDGYYYNKPDLTDEQISLLNRLLPTLSGKDRETMLSIINSNKGGRK